MRTYLTLLILLASSIPAAAQDMRVVEDDEACEQQGWGDRPRYCEVREITLPAGRSVIDIDGGQNGGIRVQGWDRDEILVRAIVSAAAGSEREAREHVEQVAIDTRGVIQADIPARINRGRDWTSVSFELMVPHRSNLALETHNGGVYIEEVAGDIRFDALNGGVKLVDLAGDVRGETTNGGLDIELSGSEWAGDGLNVETTNGGVEIRVPDDYSARLETATTNGGIRFDFPVMLQGKMDRRVSVDLGDGGRPIRAVTTNGGVRVRRS